MISIQDKSIELWPAIGETLLPLKVKVLSFKIYYMGPRKIEQVSYLNSIKRT
jgi:hypothetical protein